MQLFRRTVAALFLLIGASTAQSTPIDFTFDYQFTSGPLTGTLGSVFVTLEGYTGIGHETFDPSDGGLLDFSTSVSGISLALADSAGPPDTPLLEILDGLLLSVDATFAGTTTDGQYLFDFEKDSPDQKIFLQSTPNGPGDQAISFGSWDSETFRQLPGSVPAPATLALFALGLAGLGVSRRMRNTQG